MRKIDWSGPLSPEDVAFLVQAGIPGMEERVKAHQALHGGESFDAAAPDTATQFVGPRGLVDADILGGGDIEEEEAEPDDDYDDWTKLDLDNEVTARNAIEGTTPVEVVGTGKDGNVLKPDLIKALRVWDQMNPEAIPN